MAVGVDFGINHTEKGEKMKKRVSAAYQEKIKEIEEKRSASSGQVKDQEPIKKDVKGCCSECHKSNVKGSVIGYIEEGTKDEKKAFICEDCLSK